MTRSDHLTGCGELFGELKMTYFTTAPKHTGYANLNAVGELGEIKEGYPPELVRP